jgi:hypothetical protein
MGGTGGHGKAIVVGAVQRKGKVIARVIDSTDADTLNEFVQETVSHRVSLVSTDDHRGYRYIDKSFPHGMVHHGQGEYVHGNIHTNRSGSANLNSAISGNSGHDTGPKAVWRKGVFDGQEISAAHPPHP